MFLRNISLLRQQSKARDINLKAEVFCEKVFPSILHTAFDLIGARYIKFKIYLLATSPLRFMRQEIQQSVHI